MTEYMLIDCATDLIYGPYDSYAEARDRADSEELENWEIINAAGNIVDWSPRSTP